MLIGSTLSLLLYLTICPSHYLLLAAELLYPSGLFRKPLRFAAKRAIVNSPSWRPGGYLVLDTGGRLIYHFIILPVAECALRIAGRAPQGPKRWRLEPAAPTPSASVLSHAARGMLRLEPASPADHARWVLALNAAFLASGAVPGGASGGSSPASRQAAAAGEARLQAVGAMRWSPAILFG